MIRPLFVATLLASSALAADVADPRCASDAFSIDTNFASSALHKCKFKAEDVVEITIKPEDRKVTVEQPWFAFRVTAQDSRELKIRLKFVDGYARYWPKTSGNLVDWERMPESAVSVSSKGNRMNILLAVGDDPVFVAAQEVLPLAWYDDWFATLEAHPDITVSTIGQSIEGREIKLAKTRNHPEVVILLGRQHPAEIPGALAMRDFVDTVLADTELARAFRARFALLIVPLVNPDGVANGHWRHNSGRTDLNRDWGPFKQPETQAIAKILAGLEALEMQPRLMLDFHATKYTDSLMFYTQASDEVTDPFEFDLNWFAAVRERLPAFEFVHDPRPSQTNPNTKGYFHRRYGIPAFTYELGDEADRQLLHETTPVFAEEMMRELLNAEKPGE